MKNQSTVQIQNETSEKKEWVKPELHDLNVNTGMFPSSAEEYPFSS